MRWILLAAALSCSPSPEREIPLKPSELDRAMQTCNLETLTRELSRARIDMALHAYEPEKALSARWRWRLVNRAIEWCGEKL